MYKVIKAQAPFHNGPCAFLSAWAKNPSNQNPRNPEPRELKIMKKQKSLKGRTASRKKCAQKPPDTKRRGEIGEAAFLHKASSMGFGVAKPWGDSDRYDLVVDVVGRLLKVQVKSAHRVCAQAGGGYHIRAHPHQRIPYRADEIDFLVAYIVPEDIWYVFPPSAFKKMKSMRLFPYRGKKRSKFERYREAWHVFREMR
jgi:hypothetical protein